ncbi:hypothetical protein B4135_2151 [Caldibacillus debilis]|uniref:Uncharacterized protein n=1 Tax=Caldibacillus debilis TaxID=301148 RepID=A0A150M3Q2_9BACI|nr:hypothetical protein B4135_2151 [Caldibacillus debilis]
MRKRRRAARCSGSPFAFSGERARSPAHRRHGGPPTFAAGAWPGEPAISGEKQGGNRKIFPPLADPFVTNRGKFYNAGKNHGGIFFFSRGK